MKKFKFAFPDVDRERRQGFPEAIFCPGKKIEQIIHIARKILNSGSFVMATKAEPEIYKKIKKKFKYIKYYPEAKIIVIENKKQRFKSLKTSNSYICVITAGTSDIPVAEESAVTCEVLGSKVERVYDIGIAGIHRITQNLKKIQNASCVIVCAGMEGALPGIIGGLVKIPVIGVPTSVGYGTNFGGLTALFTMLNSCVANLVCVNIDDGYGAGVTAHLINRGRCLII